MSKIVGLTFEEEKQKFPCPVCGKEYASEKKLTDHIAKEHPDFNKGGNDDAQD